MAGIYVTNGGAHPPEKWAVITGEHIFPIDDRVDGSRLREAKRAQLAVIDALVSHHESNQGAEKSRLSTKGAEHLDAEHDVEDGAKSALQSVISALNGTPWQEKSENPEWQRVVLGEIASHMATSQHIERQWHCHRNPKCEKSAAWLAAVHPVTEPEKE